LLSKLLPERQREVILGDLEEERHELNAGTLWCWIQTLSIAPRYCLENFVQLFLRDDSPHPDKPKGDGIMTKIRNDIRYGIRMLIKTPVFTIVAILTLGLAIGGTTAIFSIVNALLIRPLPLPNAERLVSIIGTDASGNPQYMSYPDFEDLSRQAKLFDGFSAFVPQSVNLTGQIQPQRVRGGFVSDNFFDLIGVQPAIGRSFTAGRDDREGSEPVCIVQYETWQNLFGGNPNFLGTSLILNNETFTVIGILPQSFRFPFDEVEVWIPHHYWPYYRGMIQDGSINNRAQQAVGPIATIRKDVEFHAAQAELRTIFDQLSIQHSEAGKRNALMQGFRELVVGDVKQIVLVLMGAMCFVLLIACTNVANLLLSRTATRQRELATRAALGAGRSRLLAQLFTETALLWSAGCILGLFVGRWALAAFLAAAPDDLPGGIIANLDLSVFAFTLFVSALTAILFGMIPAIRFTSPNVLETIKEGGHGSGGSLQRARLRTGLVIGQLALTLMLLAGSALMLRSFQRLTSVNVGFRPENLLTMEYRLPQNKYPEPAQQWQTHKQIIEKIRQLPGVRNAALINGLPFSGNGGTTNFQIVGRSPEKPLPRARINSCSTDYFQTMGIPLLKGRVFSDQDRDGTPLVAVINQYIAERYWPGQNPVGNKIQIVDEAVVIAAEIIGIVGNTKQYGMDDPDIGYIYGAQAQNPGIFNTIAVRTVGEPMQMAKAVTQAVWSVDPQQPVWKVRTQQSLIERSVGVPKFFTQLMTVYAALALLLAAVGIYGVMSYSVTQRTYEIGLRMALGAQRSDVFRIVLRYGLIVTGIGLVIGLIGSLALGSAVQSLLFQTSASDPVALAIVALILTTITLIATYPPARRATRVDPLVSLRYE
jgi:putative ABC transport system permease protein